MRNLTCALFLWIIELYMNSFIIFILRLTGFSWSGSGSWGVLRQIQELVSRFCVAVFQLTGKCDVSISLIMQRSSEEFTVWVGMSWWACIIKRVCKEHSVNMQICVLSSSYLHCEWATEQHLVKDKRIHQKIKRFKIKQAQKAHFFADVRTPLFLITWTNRYCVMIFCGFLRVKCHIM